MRDKDKYLDALKQSNGRYNAVDIGAQIGLHEDATMKIITQLLAEFKIDYVTYRNCDYTVMKKQRK